MSDKQKVRNRRDHYLPQGYLKGFIDPQRSGLPKPLWCFNLHTKRWKERAPKEIGYIDGFYDYSTEDAPAEHPDITFKHLENFFPRVRNQILREGFSTWIHHKDFLLQYMQMIRARSPLFFDQWREQAKAVRISTVIDVSPDRRSVKVDSPAGRPMSPGETQNWTISKMREEVQRGSGWLTDFHWALRYTTSSKNPVITSEQPLTSIGTSKDPATAISDPETLIYFPMSWQTFLFGSLRPFDVETEEFHPDTLRRVRQGYIENGASFLVSPKKLEEL